MLDAILTPPRQMAVLRFWHAALVGGLVVAWLTGDEDTYAMHVFSGTWVLGALALRLALAGLVRRGPLCLHRPSRSALRQRLMGGGSGRHPILPWMAAALLGSLILAAGSGWLADGATLFEGPHEALAEVSLWVIGFHIVAVIALFGNRRKVMRWFGGLRGKPVLGLIVLGMVLTFAAGAPAFANPKHQSLLASYRAEILRIDPAFQDFSAARGEAFFLAEQDGGKTDMTSCATCHTPDPTRSGRHVKTGRPIDPVAVSANPERFTDPEHVEKRFARDCPNVLGRACTPTEKGDYVAFMLSR